MPKLPFDNPQEWVRWHAHQVETPAWWPELVKLPTPRDPISFAKWVQASFQFPKAKFLRKGENDHTSPPAPHCIEWDTFLPQTEGNFVSQDYRLRQAKKTLAFAKALQFWVEKAQPPQIDKLHQLAVCVRELREAMEPLISFTNEDVLANDPPSPWKKITSSRSSKEGGEEVQEATRGWGWNTMQRACPRGSFQTTPFLGHSRPLIIPLTTMVATTSTPLPPAGRLFLSGCPHHGTNL